MRYLLLIGILIFASTDLMARELKDRYPDINIVTLSKLSSMLADPDNKLVMIDTNPPTKYPLGHIPRAVNLFYRDINFEFNLEKILQSLGGRGSLVFYCYGKYCPTVFPTVLEVKEYLVSRKLYNQYPIYVYYNGLIEWIAVGNPIEPEEMAPVLRKAIEIYNNHKLPFIEFSDKLYNSNNTRLIDVSGHRNPKQINPFINRRREWYPPQFPGKLEEVLHEIKAKGQIAMFYDLAGYSIFNIYVTVEKVGLKEFYFLEGGHRGYEEFLWSTF